MESKLYRILICLVLMVILMSSQIATQYMDFRSPAGWDHTYAKELPQPECMNIKPKVKDIIRRIHAILPYLDRDHQNVQFIQTYRNTLDMMSKGEDLLDREAAFYAAVITPILFLHKSKDVWCVLERFHQALTVYKTCTSSEKRTVLKTLQNLRDINKKVQAFISKLPDQRPMPRITTQEFAEEYHQKDNRIVKELIKNIF